MHHLSRILAGALALALAQAVLIPPQAALADPRPGGALDISFVQGDVDIQRGDDDDNAYAAVRNAPLLPGDILSTGPGAYAEIHMGRGVRLRLDSDTQIRVARIDPAGNEVQLGQGNVELRVFSGATTAQVDTPQIAITTNRPGTYGASIFADGTSAVTAYSGGATVLGQSTQQPLWAGQSIHASGSPDVAALQTLQAEALSPEFVAFNQSRDAAIARAYAQAQAYAQIDGVEDLAAYGRWVNTSYGVAWVPLEPVGWTPYSVGHWVWEPYYGYVWVAYEPWGWAPYHYGRWVYQSAYGWAWVPGRPAPWSPALVAFFQSGSTIAWLALAPGDPFVPWWGPRVAYVNNVVNINVYRNVYVARAIVTTPVVAFRTAAYTRVTTVGYANLAARPVAVNVVNVAPPTRAHLAFSEKVVSRPSVRAASFQSRTTTFVGHPLAVQRAPFVQPAPNYHPPMTVQPYAKPAAPAATYARPPSPTPTYVRPSYVRPSTHPKATAHPSERERKKQEENRP